MRRDQEWKRKKKKKRRDRHSLPSFLCVVKERKQKTTPIERSEKKDIFLLRLWPLFRLLLPPFHLGIGADPHVWFGRTEEAFGLLLLSLSPVLWAKVPCAVQTPVFLRGDDSPPYYWRERDDGPVGQCVQYGYERAAGRTRQERAEKGQREHCLPKKKRMGRQERDGACKAAESSQQEGQQSAGLGDGKKKKKKDSLQQEESRQGEDRHEREQEEWEEKGKRGKEVERKKADEGKKEGRLPEWRQRRRTGQRAERRRSCQAPERRKEEKEGEQKRRKKKKTYSGTDLSV